MKLIFERKIAHDGNIVLLWMMDNVYIKTDSVGNIKMDKEKSTERIDGAVTLVKVFDRAIRNSEENSVYSKR